MLTSTPKRKSAAITIITKMTSIATIPALAPPPFVLHLLVPPVIARCVLFIEEDHLGNNDPF